MRKRKTACTNTEFCPLDPLREDVAGQLSDRQVCTQQSPPEHARSIPSLTTCPGCIYSEEVTFFREPLKDGLYRWDGDDSTCHLVLLLNLELPNKTEDTLLIFIFTQGTNAFFFFLVSMCLSNIAWDILILQKVLIAENPTVSVLSTSC